MTTPAEAPEFLPFDFVYAGRRALKGDNPGAEIFQIVNGQLGNSYVFAAKLLKGSVIGGVYRGAMFSKDQARGLGSAAFVERWKDQLACIDWQSRDEAFEADQRRSRLEADAKKVNEIEAMLLPLRKLYASYSRQYDHAGKRPWNKRCCARFARFRVKVNWSRKTHANHRPTEVLGNKRFCPLHQDSRKLRA